MSDLILHSIGVIRTPFIDKYTAPRQPGADGENAIGKVLLERGHNFEQALDDIEGFKKIWLLYQFDRNNNWKPKVLPPRSDIKRGVFATRSPHRPNPIGLSLVTLLEVRGRTLVIEGVDMLDKTPLFDIKPYIPQIDSYPNARTGWLELASEKNSSPRTISFSAEAQMQLRDMPPNDVERLTSHIGRMLRFDIMPHPYKRITQSKDDVNNNSFVLAYKIWRIEFIVQPEDLVIVRRVRLAQ